LFTPAPPPRGQQLSIYLPAHALEVLRPWAAGRQRSSRLAAIVERYDAVADQRPQLSKAEWGIVVQLLGPLATMRQVGALWAEVLDRDREGQHLPGVDAEALARKLRQMTTAEQIAVLEVADRAALAAGPLRARLAAAGVGGLS
jgi:hypothetical protein